MVWWLGEWCGFLLCDGAVCVRRWDGGIVVYECGRSNERLEEELDETHVSL